MQFDDNKLKEILVRENYITNDDVKQATEATAREGISFVKYLLREQILSQTLLGQAIAEAYGVAYADLSSKEPSHEQVLEIPEDIAKRTRTVLFAKDTNKYQITTDNPKDSSLESQFKAIFPEKEFIFSFSLSSDIDRILLNYQKSLNTRFSKIIKTGKRVAPEILEEIFEDAYAFRASDIHFEPRDKEVIVRFRIDGVLHDAGRVDKEYYENILNKIKVESSMRIDEHFSAQDGSMHFEKKGKVFDMRTSIVPTVEGEKVVLRMLASYTEGFSLSELGLTEDNEKILRDSVDKPFGMILVTGPTGSGKTTTLYGVVKVLNDPSVNITTIEDPVEYKIPGVNQIQTNPETNLTFAKGLRSVVRQDPDIILVGEIRDEETAEIAVNAALTGHLLLSTFHANDASTAIPRLIDMKIEPFLLASTLEVVIAQRLARKICNSCRYSINFNKKEFTEKWKNAEKYFTEENITLYQGKGCDVCGGTGFKGRTAIFEFIKITPAMQELILRSPSTAEIWNLAKKEGARSLFEDGILKVKSGLTTIDELMRVAPPPDLV